MFYTINVTPVVHGQRRESFVLGYYQDLDKAKERLMDWAQDQLKKDPDRKYGSLPADGRQQQKVLLRCQVIAPGSSTGMEGCIVENAFEDEPSSFMSRAGRVVAECGDALRGALAYGETVEIPYDRDGEECDNAEVMAIGNNGDFRVALTAVGKDSEGKIFVSAIATDNGLEYSRIEAYNIVSYEWPYIADLVLGVKNKDQKKEK